MSAMVPTMALEMPPVAFGAMIVGVVGELS